MSVEALAVVLHHSKAKSTALNVLIGIANHAGDGGAWPSMETLARYGRCSERQAQRIVQQLVGLGEVDVHVQMGGPSGIPDWRRPNRYDVLVACPATCDRTSNHRPKRLPKAPADLWIEGVTPMSPGDTHVTGGVTPMSPGGVTPMSPEPSLEPTSNPGVPQEPELQDARPRTRPRSCSVCSLPEQECRRRTPVSGHEFTSSSEEASA